MGGGSSPGASVLRLTGIPVNLYITGTLLDSNRRAVPPLLRIQSLARVNSSGFTENVERRPAWNTEIHS